MIVNVIMHELYCILYDLHFRIHASFFTVVCGFTGNDMGGVRDMSRLNVSCHLWTSHVTYEVVTSHMKESWHK